MEIAIRDRYNDKILKQTAGRYGVSADSLKLLDGFESYMFEFEKDGRPTILRLGHSLRRSKELILGEVDWINYLADNGVRAARALPSPQGEMVEAIDDEQGGQFLAVAFAKAPGGFAWATGHWNEALFRQYGQVIGRMHALSTQYRLPNPAWKRQEWDDPEMLYFAKWIPEEDQDLIKTGDKILDHLRSLPKNDQVYGLIHQDAHGGNFFVDELGHMTLFDFDDCVYSWFIYDIAMVLFYAITNDDDPAGHGAHFWSYFWPAYRREFDLDPLWLEQIQPFMKLREVDLYGVIHRSYDVENMSDSWAKKFMQGRREKILGSPNYVDIDFTRF